MRPEAALLFAALTYVANIAGSIVGGTMADRWGRPQTILVWSCVSLAVSFSIGWLILYIAATFLALIIVSVIFTFLLVAIGVLPQSILNP